MLLSQVLGSLGLSLRSLGRRVRAKIRPDVPRTKFHRHLVLRIGESWLINTDTRMAMDTDIRRTGICFQPGSIVGRLPLFSRKRARGGGGGATGALASALFLMGRRSGCGVGWLVVFQPSIFLGCATV